MKIPDSDRLSFRLFNQNDGADLFELDQDEAVMQFINGGKKNTREDIDNIFIPRLLSYLNPELGWGQYKVTVKATNQYIGWVLVRPVDFFTDKPNYQNLELGWRFNRASWGKGYATEAARAISDEVIKHQDVHYLSAIAHLDNLASIGVMKKLGMQYIKTYTHQDPLGDIEAVYYHRALD